MRKASWFGTSLFFLLITVAGTTAWSAVIHVSPSGDVANDGSSWAAALPSVQGALDAANPGDSVWVQQGTYLENLSVPDGVALMGGFEGAETEESQRNWQTHVTILDGQTADSVIKVAPKADEVTIRISGFTIRNGQADKGGGIFISNASPHIDNNIIEENNAGQGGGICSEAGGEPLIVDNRIQNNQAAAGGGICIDDSSPSILANIIASNSAQNILNGGKGGGICVISGSATIVNNLIRANSASGSRSVPGLGGGVYHLSAQAQVINNTFVENSADDGGGLSYTLIKGDLGNLEIANNIFASNTSGLHTAGTQAPVLRNNCLFSNTDYDYGTGVGTGTNDIAENPLFVGKGNYRLTEESPCIDAGNNSSVPNDITTDLDGLPRFVRITTVKETLVDMGAYEYQAARPTPTPTETPEPTDTPVAIPATPTPVFVTPTPIQFVTPTPIFIGTATPTPEPTDTPAIIEPTSTPHIVTPTPIQFVTPTPIFIGTATPTPEPGATNTPQPTNTPVTIEPTETPHIVTPTPIQFVTPTPIFMPTATPTPGAEPSATPTPECEGIDCVILHFYEIILSRTPSSGEVDAWHYGYFEWMVGQDVDVRFVPSEMGRQFFLSDEYQSRNRNDGEFITDCYSAFLYRAASSGELAGWTPVANRKEAMSIFSRSDEFQNRVVAMFPGLGGNPTRNFVSTMYLGLLDRLPDPGGLAFYADQFDAAADKRARAKQMGREVTEAEEYLIKRNTNELRVESMYRAYLGRYPNNSETVYWTGELNSGRLVLGDLIEAFADSDEFTERLNTYFP